VALWQNQGKIALVDDNGVVMHGIDIAPYQKLPLIIGDNAPRHARELIEIMASEPELAKRFSSATRVGDRRWNVRLSAGKGGTVEVRLPESHPEAAWKKLAEIEQQQRLLDREVKVIDLRLEGKMFIKLSPESEPAKTGNARET
jgi:cell division protein FtsQ